MAENITNEGNDSGRKEQPQPDDFFESTRKIADKAEEFAAQAALKFKESQAFDKINAVYRKITDYMDEKSEHFSRGDFAEKMEEIKEKTVQEADNYIEKARHAGKDLANEIDKAVDAVRQKMKKK